MWPEFLSIILLEVDPIARIQKRISIIINQIIGPSLQDTFNNVGTMPKGFEFTYT
jgi:hypothetical protein